MNTRKIFVLLLVAASVFYAGGCGATKGVVNNISGLVGLSDSGTVIAPRAQIRSSYAVVAADLLEVKRGDKLDILEETDFEKIHWYRVRAKDEDRTEGWIEAQNLITSETLEKSKKIHEADKDLPAQATGQLRAASNLRLSPERKDDNLLFKLENGATFEITDWTYVPKAQEDAGAAAGTDDAAYKSQQKQTKTEKNADVEASKEKGEPEKLDDKYDIWYKVRLDPSVSPAPTGWLFGRQIELLVPNDIVFHQSNTRKFVTWQRIDNVNAGDRLASKDPTKGSKPGSWVVLSRSPTVKAVDGVEPDFDGIIILDYDKYKEEHYIAYRSGEVWGVIPLRVEGSGDSRTFTVKMRNNATNQMEDKRFAVYKDKNRLRVTPPENMASFDKPVKQQ